MLERMEPPRRTPPLFMLATSLLTPDAMCFRQGLIQLSSTFNQPLELSIQLSNHTTEARRESMLT
jgi:hypothetical protein